MTAEVALLNKSAIALAADSAVTSSSAERQKIHNAGNKVFALSKRHPVGIMVYGNAEFMGVPWETVIKVYRANLDVRSFNSLSGYYDNLLDFLGGDDLLFGRDTPGVRSLPLGGRLASARSRRDQEPRRWRDCRIGYRPARPYTDDCRASHSGPACGVADYGIRGRI
jgi:hypothetical protein